LTSPSDVVVDDLGNVFILDLGNFRVRQVFANGSIRTVAGKGVSEYSGDAGPATEAGLQQPVALAIDRSGYLFIADSESNRGRRVGGLRDAVVSARGVDVDFDLDGVVGFGDFLLFAEAFGGVDGRLDLNDDGVVGFADFLSFAQAFGQKL